MVLSLRDAEWLDSRRESVGPAASRGGRTLEASDPGRAGTARGRDSGTEAGDGPKDCPGAFEGCVWGLGRLAWVVLFAFACADGPAASPAEDGAFCVVPGGRGRRDEGRGRPLLRGIALGLSAIVSILVYRCLGCWASIQGWLMHRTQNGLTRRPGSGQCKARVEARTAPSINCSGNGTSYLAAYSVGQVGGWVPTPTWFGWVRPRPFGGTWVP